MSPSMDVDVAEMRAAATRVSAQHDAITHQAYVLDGFTPGAGCSGPDYAAAGRRSAEIMRGTVVQAVQEFGAETRAVASTLTATVNQYVATEGANSRRLTS